MIVKLKELAKITAGVHTKSVLKGEVYGIHARDYKQGLTLRSDLQPTLVLTKTLQKHLLTIGDILVIARGEHFLAILYQGEVQPAVASSTFLILRNIDSTQILPAYLVWWINQSKSQHYLQSLAKGSAIFAINKKILGDMPVTIPTLQKQQLLLEIANLLQQEDQLQTQIKTLKQQLINQQLLNIIDNA